MFAGVRRDVLDIVGIAVKITVTLVSEKLTSMRLQGLAPLSRLTHLKREGKQRENSGFRFLDAQIDHW
ncbi:MAG TPA: hypothetical protein VEU97_01790 [Ktedonobacteraceae bacterium]|nr:hypothetical protein [Ktedonobacteraceae bacterium]